MKHKTEGGSKDQIEAPGNGTPMKEAISCRPLFSSPEALHIGFPHIANPLAKGIKENIRRKSCGKHHASPSEERIFRFFIRLSENDISVRRKSNVKGKQKNKGSQAQIVYGKFRSQKVSYAGKNPIGIFRIDKEEKA